MYSGDEGVYTYTFETEQKPDCPVCGNLAKTIHVPLDFTLQQFLDSLGERAEAQLKKPSLTGDGKTLYMRIPASLEEQTRPNLDKRLSDLIEDGEEVGEGRTVIVIENIRVVVASKRQALPRIRGQPVVAAVWDPPSIMQSAGSGSLR